MTNKKLLPQQEEQPCNPSPNDTALTLADAIRMSCSALGVDHDVAELIVGGTLARYHPMPDAPLRELIESLSPGVLIKSEFLIHEHGASNVACRSKAQAERIAAAITATLGGEYVTLSEEIGSEYKTHWLSASAPHGKYQFDIVYTPDKEVSQ